MLKIFIIGIKFYVTMSANAMRRIDKFLEFMFHSFSTGFGAYVFFQECLNMLAGGGNGTEGIATKRTLGCGDKEGGGVNALVMGCLVNTDLLGCARKGAWAFGGGVLTCDLWHGRLILGWGHGGGLFIPGFI